MELNEMKHLAELSKLEFTDAELGELSKDFESLVELADIVKNSQVKGQRKFLSVDMCELREDVAKPSMITSEILQNAPSKSNDCFMVPRIME